MKLFKIFFIVWLCLITNIFAGKVATLYPRISHNINFETTVYHRITQESLEKYNVITFLPERKSGTDSIAETPQDIIAAIKKKTGVIKINNTLYRIYKGVPYVPASPATITLYAGGYSNAGKPYGYCVYNAIKCGIIAGCAVVFDYPTDTSFRTFNFCQDQDLGCLAKVYKAVIEFFPYSDIILFGACKGGTNKLRFLAEAQNKQIAWGRTKALIVESPVITPYHALKNQFCGSFAHWLMKYIFPNYNPENLKTIMDASSFPSKIPVLLGSLPEDTVSELPNMIALKEHLASLGVTVEHFVAQGEDAQIIHGQIGKSRSWQEKVREFLTSRGLRPSVNAF